MAKNKDLEDCAVASLPSAQYETTGKMKDLILPHARQLKRGGGWPWSTVHCILQELILNVFINPLSNII